MSGGLILITIKLHVSKHCKSTSDVSFYVSKTENGIIPKYESHKIRCIRKCCQLSVVSSALKERNIVCLFDFIYIRFFCKSSVVNDINLKETGRNDTLMFF